MAQKTFLYTIVTIAATGGLLFGFDTGVISGAIPFLQADWKITNSDIEWITTAALIGAMLGALFCGRITDTLGRQKVILAAAVIFAIGALWSGFATTLPSLIIARLFLGVAIGVSSFAVPLYLAEISPAQSRGAIVAMFQLMMTVGILLSYLSDLFFADELNPECWRPMFYVGVVPALILLFGMAFMPETPRWLMTRNREAEARKILIRIEGSERAEQELSAMKKELKHDHGPKNWRCLFQPWLRRPLLIAVAIMFFQQFVGINTVIYYSPKIFLMAGFESAVSAIWASVGIGLVNVVATVAAVSMIDRLGRRKLFFIGMTGIVFSLTCLSLCFLCNQAWGAAGQWLSVVFMFAYVAFFAISIGPLGWLIISEIFPQQVRGIGTSIGSFSVWVFNCITSFTFFKIIRLSSPTDSVGTENPAGAFVVYAAIALIGLVWGYFQLPETKNVPLEKIAEHWKNGGNARSLNSKS